MFFVPSASRRKLFSGGSPHRPFKYLQCFSRE